MECFQRELTPRPSWKVCARMLGISAVSVLCRGSLDQLFIFQRLFEGMGEFAQQLYMHLHVELHAIHAILGKSIQGGIQDYGVTSPLLHAIPAIVRAWFTLLVVNWIQSQ